MGADEKPLVSNGFSRIGDYIRYEFALEMMQCIKLLFDLMHCEFFNLSLGESDLSRLVGAGCR